MNSLLMAFDMWSIIFALALALAISLSHYILVLMLVAAIGSK